MKSSLAILVAVSACGGTTTTSPVRNGGPPPSVVTAADSDPDPIEAQIPGDALAVMYEASKSFLPVDCPVLRGKMGANFTVVQPGEHRQTLYSGDFQRAAVTKCLLDFITPGDPDVKVTDDGDTTTITSRIAGFYLKWHPHFVTLVMLDPGEPPAPASPSPSAAQIAAFHALRGAKVAMWSRLPFMKVLTGFDAPEVTVLLDAWDMPAEWHRKVSGTIIARFASPADAHAAAAQI
jgi:hypothetical protein